MLTAVCSECNSREVLNLLDVFEAVLQKPLERPQQQQQGAPTTNHADVKAAVCGLVQVRTLYYSSSPVQS